MIKDTFKNKVDRLKWKADAKINKFKANAKKVGKWASEHPGESIAILSVGATLLGGVNKLANKAVKAKDEYDREREYYDPRLGNWAYTRRKLTAKEKIELSERNKNGESVTQILYSMNLLKR